MNAAVEFFKAQAGYGYNPETETPDEGKQRCAEQLAQAETLAKQLGYFAVWEQDQDGCVGCDCQSPDCACSNGDEHECLVCLLYDGSKPLDEGVMWPVASLGSVCQPSREYMRVVEAELALEALA